MAATAPPFSSGTWANEAGFARPRRRRCRLLDAGHGRPHEPHRAGSLDCHGETHRNLRLYGYGGLRLDPATLPEFDITDAEIDADYDAVIALEPEKMADLVRENGNAPERLTLVRKARGAEDHKGGNPIIAGDDADRCLVTWLASATDVAACQRTLTQR